MTGHLLLIESRGDAGPHDMALNDAFVSGARSANWNVHRLDAAAMQLRSSDFDTAISQAAAANLIRATDRLAIIFPLQCNALPSQLRNLLDCAERDRDAPNVLRLKGRMLQLIITMELPAFLYRPQSHREIGADNGLWFGKVAGFAVPQITLVGGAGAWCKEQRALRLRDIFHLGAGRISAPRAQNVWSPDAYAA
jgi:hypothetical protein